MGGEEGLSPLLILARCFLADPGPGGTDPLWAGPVAPRLIPSPGRAHKGRRSPSPAQPRSPTTSTEGSPRSTPTEPPGDGPPDPQAGGAEGTRGQHGHSRGCGAAPRGRPAPAPWRAGRDVSPRWPLAPHALTLSVPPLNSPRPPRARPGADRARRPPTGTDPTAPPPPAACSLPLYP